MITISILIAFLFNLFNEIITQLRKLNGEKFPDIEDNTFEADVVVINEDGILYIDNIPCTFDDKDVRDYIEDTFEDYKHFTLPNEFTFNIIESNRGKVAKIKLK